MPTCWKWEDNWTFDENRAVDEKGEPAIVLLQILPCVLNSWAAFKNIFKKIFNLKTIYYLLICLLFQTCMTEFLLWSRKDKV